MHLTIYAISVLWGLCAAHPQEGYGYSQPQPQPPPANLYETPERTPAPPPPPRPQPPQNNYGSPSDKQETVDPPPSGDDSPPMEGMPYDFNWGVEDPDSGNSFSHVETSDGQRTEGEYRVLLPDGRMQVVKFYDDGNGFNADVTYT